MRVEEDDPDTFRLVINWLNRRQISCVQPSTMRCGRGWGTFKGKGNTDTDSLCVL